MILLMFVVSIIRMTKAPYERGLFNAKPLKGQCTEPTPASKKTMNIPTSGTKPKNPGTTITAIHAYPPKMPAES